MGTVPMDETRKRLTVPFVSRVNSLGLTACARRTQLAGIEACLLFFSQFLAQSFHNCLVS